MISLFNSRKHSFLDGEMQLFAVVEFCFCLHNRIYSFFIFPQLLKNQQELLKYWKSRAARLFNGWVMSGLEVVFNIKAFRIIFKQDQEPSPAVAAQARPSVDEGPSGWKLDVGPDYRKYCCQDPRKLAKCQYACVALFHFLQVRLLVTFQLRLIDIGA